jgi:uncharacterized protein with GYD domain
MPKYLIEASYSVEGLKGLAKEGGSKRRKAIEKAIEGLGGEVEAVYFAFGDPDVYVLLKAPDNITAAALSVAIGATGSVRLKTVVLLSPEDMDRAIKKSVAYRAPGA